MILPPLCTIQRWESGRPSRTTALCELHLEVLRTGEQIINKVLLSFRQKGQPSILGRVSTLISAILP